MDFLYLSVTFFIAGVAVIFYHYLVPNKDILRKRLPNKVSLAAIILVSVIAFVLWYIFSQTTGFWRRALIFTLLFALLFFETLFLLLIRWFKSNALAVIASILITVGFFLVNYIYPTFIIRNLIIILAAFGAGTLLVRFNYLKTWFLFGLAILWTFYDIYITNNFLPKVLVPVTEPSQILFFPAVIIKSVSLGSGDFVFLALFLLVTLRDCGPLYAILLLMAETVGLIMASFLITLNERIIPFLVFMTPIFFLIYFVSYISKKKLSKK